MPLEEFLAQSVTLLAAAVAVVVICARLKVPAVAGLLVTGLVIGPSGLGLIADSDAVHLFAEIGVVLLLFVIGLELSLGQIKELKRPFLIGGTAQVALSLGAVAALALVAGEAPNVAFFLGCVVALSSTAVVLKLYADRRESRTPQGRVVLGILLLQDFVIVPMIVLVPVLAGEVAASPMELAGRFGGALAVVAAVFFGARVAVPRLLDLIARTRAREVFVLGAMALCLGLAWLTHHLGFSLALGAFLAGLLVSETEYSHQMIADIGPFRDLFASVFFVSIGMLVDLPFAAAHLPQLLGLAGGVVALKTLAAGAAVKLLGYPLRIAAVAGLGLAQIGEFSFVLMEVGLEHGLLDGEAFQTLLGAAVATLLVAPGLIVAAPAVGSWLARWGPPLDAAGDDAGEPLLSGHVVVAGYGTCGSLLARVLEEARLPFVVVELNPERVHRIREQGRRVVFGDASRREILAHAGVERAGVAVFAISDPRALAAAVRLTRELAPAVEIVVRTRTVEEIDGLQQAGADQVVAEEFETAIEIFTRVLARHHVPRNVIRAQTRVLRGEGYRMLRVPREGAGVSDAVLDALAAGTTDVYRIAAGGPAAGRSLRQLDLRRHAGATVIAVVRGESSHSGPSPDLVLEAGDSLVLVGGHGEIDRAFALLDRGGESR